MRTSLVVLLCLLAVACGGSRDIRAATPEAVIAGVNVGDEVSVTSKNGTLHQFIVTKMTNKALYGNNERVNYADMGRVEVKSHQDGLFKSIGKLF